MPNSIQSFPSLQVHTGPTQSNGRGAAIGNLEIGGQTMSIQAASESMAHREAHAFYYGAATALEALPARGSAGRMEPARNTPVVQQAVPVAERPAKWKVLAHELAGTYEARVNLRYDDTIEKRKSNLRLEELSAHIERAKKGDPACRNDILEALTGRNDGRYSRVSWLAHCLTGSTDQAVHELDEHLALHLDLLKHLSNGDEVACREILDRLGAVFKKDLMRALDDRIYEIPSSAKAYGELLSIAGTDIDSGPGRYAEKLLGKLVAGRAQYADALQAIRGYLRPAQEAKANRLLGPGATASPAGLQSLEARFNNLSKRIEERLYKSAHKTVRAEDVARIEGVKVGAPAGARPVIQMSARAGGGDFFLGILGLFQEVNDENAQFDADRAGDDGEEYHEWIHESSDLRRFGASDVFEQSAETTDAMATVVGSELRR